MNLLFFKGLFSGTVGNPSRRWDGGFLWTGWRIVIASFLFILGYPENAAARTPARISVYDLCVSSGQSVSVRARLITNRLPLFSFPISGERILFQLGQDLFGPVLTSGEGQAVGRFSPPQAGLYTIKAQLVENPRTESKEAEGLLLFGSVGQPIIVISVDSIKRPVPSGPFPFSGWGSQKPMPKASQILRQLAETYQMIYIESGNNLKHLQTRDWLDREDLPKAPLFVLSPTDDPEERTEQTIKELEKCQGAGAFFMGITRSVDEAKAFKTMGMRVVVLSEDEENKFPKGTQVIKTWEGVPL